MVSVIRSASCNALNTPKVESLTRRDASSAKSALVAACTLPQRGTVLSALDAVMEAGQVAAHLSAAMHPVGFVASAVVGPKIETNDGNQFSVPQLLANAALTTVEKNYARFAGDVSDVEPNHIASWGGLAQRVAPSKESLLDGALLALGTIASKGKNPRILMQAKNGKTAIAKSLKSVREDIGKVQEQLKDKQTLLEQTKVQRSVYESGPGADAAAFTKYNNWVTQVEDEVSKLTSQLFRLNKQQEKLQGQQQAAAKPKKK